MGIRITVVTDTELVPGIAVDRIFVKPINHTLTLEGLKLNTPSFQNVHLDDAMRSQIMIFRSIIPYMLS